MARSQESVKTTEQGVVLPVESSQVLRTQSFVRFEKAFRATKKFVGDVGRGSLTTIGDMSDGVATLSRVGSIGSVALLVTGVGARLFNLDDATNFFSEIAIVTGAVGGVLSVGTARVADAFTKSVRGMERR